MHEPEFYLNGEDWSKYLNFFQRGISYIFLQDISNGTLTDIEEQNRVKAKGLTIAQQYFKAVSENKEEILETTLISIREYLNFYQVYPQKGEHDEFKNIYFTGMAVSQTLVKLGLLDLNKLHLKAVLMLMDHRLDNPHQARRTVLSERISSMIDNNVIDKHLGKYGWYLIYKCLFKATDELKTTNDPKNPSA